MIIEFIDEDETYGRIETNENPQRIREVLEEFRNKITEMYNIDDFFSFLREKEIEFKVLKVKADMQIYF